MRINLIFIVQVYSLNKFNTLKSPASVQSHPPPKNNFVVSHPPLSIESPASRWKMRVPSEAKLSRYDRPLLYRGLAISNTCSHAKNRNDPVPITWSKVAFPEVGFFAVAILGGGWLQSPASDGPPCNWVALVCSDMFRVICRRFLHICSSVRPGT